MKGGILREGDVGRDHTCVILSLERDVNCEMAAMEEHFQPGMLDRPIDLAVCEEEGLRIRCAFEAQTERLADHAVGAISADDVLRPQGYGLAALPARTH